MSIKEIGRQGVKWAALGQDWEKWQGTVNTLMNLQVPTDAGNFLTEIIGLDGGPCSLELVSLIEALRMCSQRYYVGQQKILSIIPNPNIVAGQTKHVQIQKWVNNEGIIYN
jgi:hypothetical protein